MKCEVILPKFGATMTEGKISHWLKREGDKVEKGEILLEVETDKAIIEVESPVYGVLEKILVENGIVVPVGQTIGIIVTKEEER